MGTWGTGNFENDEAMDFCGSLDAAAGDEPLRAAFAAIDISDGSEAEAPESCEALAAAELVAASRGHASSDLPADLSEYMQSLLPPSDELKAMACEAVSGVLQSSELVELWADSDDAEEWNRVMSGLIDRLSMPIRKPAASPKKSKVTAYQCSFCLEQIEASELLEMELQMPLMKGSMQRSIYAHAACLNSKLHPSRIVQWWRFDD